MVDETRQPAGKAADLARVRDNQRRSRARRKEYLQELETKYRTCEQVGIGASAEIQAAARQVADENKRLRQILIKHGISTDEMGDDPHPSSAASGLEAMIGKKRNCGGGGSDGMCSSEKSFATPRQDYSQMPDRGLRPLQIRDVDRQLSPQSGYESSNGGAGISSPMSSTAQQQQQLHATYSTTASLGTQPEELHTRHRQQNQQQSELSPISIYGSYSDYPPSSLPQQQAHDHDFYAHPANMDSYPAQNVHLEHQSQQNSSSSCRDIADAIRYVRPTLSQQELEREMGCQPGSDCHVPNYEAFDLMDRLSEVGAGARR